ncbi:MAG: hypothetical protein J1E31_02335, partial [Helicobacter sp.]|nr:hypothetical protein [Helicobacter sp.]
MNQEIQEFIEKMKDWERNFPIEEYDYTKYDCEIADIAKMQNEKNYDGLINFWNEKLKEDYFELKHPIYNEIKLRAVGNYWDTQMGNYVVFLDKDKKSIMVMYHREHLINFVLVEGKILIVYMRKWLAPQLLNFLRKTSSHIINLIYKCIAKDYNVKFAFTYATNRPDHQFFWMGDSYTRLNKPIKVHNNNFTFFYPKDCQKIDNEDYVYLYPIAYPSAYMHFDDSKEQTEYNKEFQSLVYNESLQEFTTLVEPKDLEFKDDFSLTLWLGLPGEKRAWLEQIEGTALILKNLLPYFSRIKVYIDGMTAYDRQIQDFPENKILHNKVIRATKEALKDTLVLDVDEFDGGGDFKNTQSLIVFKSLAGYDYRTKICYCSMCDIAVSDSGTTTFTPFVFCKKPGVIFYKNQGGALFNVAHQILIKNSKYRRINEKGLSTSDYHIPPEHIYNLAVEVLEELKNIKMHRLNVPPVELYIKKYELEKKTQIKFNDNEATQSLLKNIENQKMLLEVDNLILDKELKTLQIDEAKHSIELKTLQIKQLQVGYTKLVVRDDLPSAKTRIHNHLAYKLGSAIIENSKSLFGYI